MNVIEFLNVIVKNWFKFPTRIRLGLSPLADHEFRPNFQKLLIFFLILWSYTYVLLHTYHSWRIHFVTISKVYFINNFLNVSTSGGKLPCSIWVFFCCIRGVFCCCCCSCFFLGGGGGRVSPLFDARHYSIALDW